MMTLFQIGVAISILVFGIVFSNTVGAGIYGALLFIIVALATLFIVRNADRLSLIEGEYPVASIFSVALKGVKEVKHLGTVDLVSLLNGRFVAVSAVRVIDMMETVDGSEPARLFAAVSQFGEILSSIGGMEVHIVVVKPPAGGSSVPKTADPQFKLVILSESKSERVASMASEAARSLAERLASIGVIAEPCVCGGNGGRSCDITGLARASIIPLKVTRLPGVTMMLGSLVPLMITVLLAPNVFNLTAPLALLTALGGWLTTRVASSLLKSSEISPVGGGGLVIDKGRVKIGRVYHSFATLRRIEHYDRIVEPDDVTRFLSTMNSSFLYQSYGYIACLAIRRVDEAVFASKESFKMDMSYYDYETGGGLSRALRARKHQIRLERMRFGEKPYEVSGIFILKTAADDLEAVKVAEDSFKSSLALLGFKISYVRSPRGILRCIRGLYLPIDGVAVPVLEPADLIELRSLTLDFSWFSPFALDRIPLMTKDGVLIGRDHRGRAIFWNPSAVRNAHIAVLGPMGSGKSTLVKTMILRSSPFFEKSQRRRPLYVIVDPAGEYQKIAHELGGEIINMMDRKVNPLLLEGASPIERARFVAEIMKYLKGLKGEEVSALKECILEAYHMSGIDPNEPSTWLAGRDREVSMASVYKLVVERLKLSRGSPMEPVYRSLVDKLLDVSEGARAFNRTDLTVDELITRGGVLCLSFKDSFGVMSDDLQRVVVWTMLQQVRDKLLSMNVQEELRVMVVIDEAHRFVQIGKLVEGGIEVKVEPPLSLHLRDTRKFGAGYVLITHKPEDMPAGTIDLVGTVIALSHPNNAYASWAQEYLGLTESQKQMLLSGGIGSGFLITSEDPRPLFIQVIPEEVALVRDARKERLTALKGESHIIPSRQPVFSRIGEEVVAVTAHTINEGGERPPLPPKVSQTHIDMERPALAVAAQTNGSAVTFRCWACGYTSIVEVESCLRCGNSGFDRRGEVA